MKRPSCLIVLFVFCALELRNCLAVRQPTFKTLQELLRYHEQQQNQDSDEEWSDELEHEVLPTTTATTQQPTEAKHWEQEEPLHFGLNEEGGSGEGDFLTTTAATATTSLVTETETPFTTRRMTTCCRLGEQAGRKKHHCNPDNYLPRQYRHRNRGHNFKHTNKRPSQERNQLDKCVSGVLRHLSEEFRTCCEEAYKRMWQSEQGEEHHHGGRTHILEIPLDPFETL